MTEFQGRVSDHPVDPLFLQRWSPRAFTGEAMDEAVLLTILEAARWAPSSYNSQPWRFVYARRGSPAWPGLLGLLNPGNRVWAERAAVLLIAASRTSRDGPEGPVPSWSHSFDTGAAWMSLALQSLRLGWHAHAMVGFDRDRAFAELGFPAGHRIEAAIAIGRLGDPGLLPAELRAREAPNSRQPVGAFFFEGRYPAPG
jgi:nitroreductase